MSDTDENAEPLPPEKGDTKEEKVIEEKEGDSGAEEQVTDKNEVEETPAVEVDSEGGGITGEAKRKSEGAEDVEGEEKGPSKEAEEVKKEESMEQAAIKEDVVRTGEEEEEPAEGEQKEEQEQGEETEIEEDEQGIEGDDEDEGDHTEEGSGEESSSEEEEKEIGKEKKPEIIVPEKLRKYSEKGELIILSSSEEEVEEVSEDDLEPDPEFWDPNKMLSGPSLSLDGTIPLDIMEFNHSFGYNCRKKFNLQVLDDVTVIFASGNYLNFFNLETRQFTFRRSYLGGGIGHIKQNPNPEYEHFSVAECGKRPVIILYKWPGLEVECVLKGGAKRIYSNLDYSPDGEFLVSQSGDPDYMITVWAWKQHTILLRNKSFFNDIFKVKFSPYLEGHITTCGVAHIKFWKMATTFTGLKLQGELGRFGKTEYSDIIGVLPMPDEKVVSGCDWGNILIWDDGLIKLEVLRVGRRNCHERAIVQIFFEEGELWTISLDGHVKIWWYDKIDSADPSDDDRVILLDPSYDFYTPGMSLVSIVKRREEESLFIAQDGNGGIWQIDLNTVDTPQKSIQFYKCHAGRVINVMACSYGPYLATFGRDGQLFIYNYMTKKLLYDYQFPTKGKTMIWPSTKMIPSGDILIAGFIDGQVRVCHLIVPTPRGDVDEDDISLTLTQVIKAHMTPVTLVTMNLTGEIVVSSAEDSTIFIYKVNDNDLNNFLTPIGFLPSPDVVTYMTWHPHAETTILVGCIHGQMMEVELPTECYEDTSVSLELKTLKPRYLNFMSYKSQIKRDIHLGKVARHKERKRQKKMLDMIKFEAENPGVEVDESVFLADSSDEEVLDPIFIPPKQRIMWMQYTVDDTIWVSMSGFDAGYIYEYHMGQETEVPYRCRMIADADNKEIYSFLYDSQRQYLIFAMYDGSIRINRMKEDWRDLSDYWIMTMHDNQYGCIPEMCFSYDEKIFFSCGHDGNIFASNFHHESYFAPTLIPPTVRKEIAIKVPDVDGDIKISLEEIKVRAEQDRITKLANANKAKVREQIKDLKDRYLKVLNRNSKLLPSQTIPREELEPDMRIVDFIETKFKDNLDVIKKKMDYDLQKSQILLGKLLQYFIEPADRHPLTITGINNPSLLLVSIRQRKMHPMHEDLVKLCIEKIEEERIKGRPMERAREAPKVMPVKVAKPAILEYFLLSLTPAQRERKLGPKLKRMLQKYRVRREKWEKRQEQWEEFQSEKPDPQKNHPEDEKFLAEAIQNIGDYKFKEADDYKASLEVRDTKVKKFKEVLDTRAKQFNMKHEFIAKVYDIRTFKYEVRDRLVAHKNLLTEIQKELPKQSRELGPPVPDVDPDEFPDEKLKPVVTSLEPEREEYEIEEQFTYKHVEKKTGVQMLQDLLPERDGSFPIVNDTSQIPYNPEKISIALEAPFSDLIENYPMSHDTPFESELRTRRLTKMLFTQDTTICKMKDEIAEFNKILEQVKWERIPLNVKEYFMDLFLLTLTQELNILKKLEPVEERLTAKCDKSLRLVHNLEDDILIEQNRKIEIEKKFETNYMKEAKLQEEFRHAAESNKFYDFLKRVFRKKYRPPKVISDSDSESESSSSSSEESVADDDAGSDDSKDLGIVKPDLDVCPKGCEISIYNFAVKLRSDRHEIEQNNRELARQLEIVNKNIDHASKKLQTLITLLQNNLHEMDVYQKERQDLLNQVKCTVILNLDQIRDYNPETDEISDFLLFSKTAVSQLYKRVGVLEYENLQQKVKYKTYLRHLMRMKRDLKYMRQKIKGLLQQIQLMMYEKFGKSFELKELEHALKTKAFNKTYINELEEVVLKKLVYEIRIKSTNVREIFEAQMHQIDEKICIVQDTLVKCIRENTHRLELLQVMNKEKKELVKIISSQPKRRDTLEKLVETNAEYNKDLKKLEAILESQNKTMFELKAEIKTLKTKGLPPKEKYGEMKTKEIYIREKMMIDADTETKLPAEVEIENYLTQQEEKQEEEQEESKYAEEEEPPTKERLLSESDSSELYLTESEDIISSLVDELVRGLKMKSQKEIDTGLIVRKIMSSLMKCVSVQDIIKEIIQNIPFDLLPKQKSIVQSSAEKLHVIQEPDMSEENILKYVRELLEETIDEVFLIKDDAYVILLRLLEELIKSVPKEFLLREDSIESIVGKLNVYIEIQEVVIDIWVDKVSSVESPYKDEMMELLKMILEKVYGTGMDYLYVINRDKKRRTTT